MAAKKTTTRKPPASKSQSKIASKAQTKAERLLITGATGFLGRHLTEQLVAGQLAAAAGRAVGERVRVLDVVSPPRWLADLGVEVITGSVLDRELVERAMQGVRGVYHLAGRVSRNPDDARSMYELHVDGTRVVCEAARRQGVERIVLASSSGTVAVTESGQSLPDESWPIPMEIISRWPYYRSKVYQERTAATACGEGGPELVTINPSLLLGPGDDRLSSTRDVLKFLARDVPAIPTGGINFVDVRDAAGAFIAAMARGRPGERYLLGGPNWTFDEFFGRLSRVSKVDGPRLKAPKMLALLGARLIDGIYRQLDQLPPVELSSVEMATYYWYLDDAKARRELGFDSRDPLETLNDTVTYLKRRFVGKDALARPPV